MSYNSKFRKIGLFTKPSQFILTRTNSFLVASMAKRNHGLEVCLERNSKEISTLLEEKIQLTPVNNKALTYWEDNWVNLNPRTPPDGGWDWRSHIRSQKKSIKQRYSLAIWHEEILCGMALGYSSRGNAHVRVDLIEGAPDENHPLRGKILNIVVRVSMDYARLVKKEKLIIANPVNGLVEKYQEMGFKHYKKPNAFFRKEEVCVKGVYDDCF